MFVMIVIVDCSWRKPVSAYDISVLHWWLQWIIPDQASSPKQNLWHRGWLFEPNALASK